MSSVKQQSYPSDCSDNNDNELVNDRVLWILDLNTGRSWRNPKFQIQAWPKIRKEQNNARKIILQLSLK